MPTQLLPQQHVQISLLRSAIKRSDTVTTSRLFDRRDSTGRFALYWSLYQKSHQHLEVHTAASTYNNQEEIKI